MIAQAPGFLVGALLLVMADVAYQVTAYSWSPLCSKGTDVTSL